MLPSAIEHDDSVSSFPSVRPRKMSRCRSVGTPVFSTIALLSSLTALSDGTTTSYRESSMVFTNTVMAAMLSGCVSWDECCG